MQVFEEHIKKNKERLIPPASNSNGNLSWNKNQQKLNRKKNNFKRQPDEIAHEKIRI